MYCNPDDLTMLMPQERLLELADDSRPMSGEWGVGDVLGVVSDSIDSASREIDAFVALRYTVPLKPVPPIVADWCARLAVANLWLRRADQEGDGPKNWAKERERILKLLAKVAAGDISLGPLDSNDTPVTPEPQASTIISRKRLFTMRGW